MKMNITIESDKQKEVFDIAEDVHNLLAGNKDYVDSNIVLNFDNSLEPQTCDLILYADSCPDMEFFRQAAKEAIDAVIDRLYFERRK